MKLARFLSNSIKDKLLTQWNQANVQVFDDSHLHSRGNNTHFRVIIVSDHFEGKGPVLRTKEVYKALNELWDQGVHSISVTTFTEKEFNGNAPKPILCVNKVG